MQYNHWSCALLCGILISSWSSQHLRDLRKFIFLYHLSSYDVFCLEEKCILEQRSVHGGSFLYQKRLFLAIWVVHVQYLLLCTFKKIKVAVGHFFLDILGPSASAEVKATIEATLSSTADEGDLCCNNVLKKALSGLEKRLVVLCLIWPGVGKPTMAAPKNSFDCIN